jgi:hypothetical protein
MVDKKKAIKQTLSDTVINILSDFIIFTRMSVSIKQIMNLLDPAEPKQMFLPYNSYKGIENAFYVLKINNNNDPDYTLREELHMKAIQVVMNSEASAPEYAAAFLYKQWKTIIKNQSHD